MSSPARALAFGRGRLGAAAAAAAASLALAGCVSFAPEVPDTLIRLTPDHTAPAGSVARGKLSDAIVVLEPETERSLEALRVPVRIDPANIAYLKGAGWIEKPTRLFRALLAETIRADTDQMVLEGADYEVKGKTFIGGRLRDMGYDAQTSSVIVRYDAVRWQRGNEELERRRFEAVVPGVAAEAAAVGPALNQAANQVASEVAAWVKGG
ncbi:membrane integrity-associated transporter subunit PqiC [Novosphingobium decolorationis]|uniref:Membrane integrity-associated transporter subunit PqiC n=2 Tax=Novosphingobium decolorationis TaxID=2698673 RepID=A0ABX8EAF1_9SPHN|nr:membrane integrity-associated transporter subunit PqiC [Novosphingobium decolorationis]